MNRSSGWLRLWIVVSGLWVVVSGVIAYREISALYRQRHYEIAKDNLPHGVLVFSAAQSESDVHQYIENEADPAKFAGRTSDAPYQAFVAARAGSTIAEQAAMIALPPLALLLLGAAVAWVRTGFAKKT
jgi:hypothetical protein